MHDHDSHLVDVFNDINLYCTVDLHKWRASLMRNYFNIAHGQLSLLLLPFSFYSLHLHILSSLHFPSSLMGTRINNL